MSDSSQEGLPSGKPTGSPAAGSLPPKPSWWKEHQVLVACGITVIFQVVLMIGMYFLGVHGRLSEVEDRVTHIEYRIETLESYMSRIETSVNALDDKLDRILFGLARDGVDIGSNSNSDARNEDAD